MTTQKRLLIVGGGHAEIPLIKAAKSLGYAVITSGNDPAQIGHAYGDAYRYADFSDPDAVLAVARAEHIDAVCAAANDFAALSAAYVAERLGLPGHDSFAVTQLLHHKDQYREFAQRHGIGSPAAVHFPSKEDALARGCPLPFPVMVKPIDLTGGKGITKVERAEQWRPALERASAISRRPTIVVEAYLEGTQHSASMFLSDGRIQIVFLDDEYYYTNPFLVSGAATPSINQGQVEEALRREAEKVCRLLSLKDGLVHAQYVLHNGRPVFIEITRRCPGDLYNRFVELSTGVPYSSWVVKAELGLGCADVAPSPPHGSYFRYCVMPHRRGRLERIEIDSALQGRVVESLIWGRPGDLASDPLLSKFGIVFLKFDDPAQMRAVAPRLDRLIRTVVTPTEDREGGADVAAVAEQGGAASPFRHGVVL